MDIDETNSSLRPMFCELGGITRADGSSIFSCGDTTVACAVYGPGEVRPNRESINKSSIEVAYRSRNGNSGLQDRKRELFLEKTCESGILAALHPRTAITINIQEMHDDGGLLSACVNSAFLSLLDACVSLRFLVAAVTCAVDNEGNLHLDPSKKEMKRASATLVFVFESRSHSIISSHTEGLVNQLKYQQCCAMAKSAAAKTLQFYRVVMNKKFSKDS
eukprot:TRINITY_DN15744_c0_g1_i1.p1 TRINITY_DN15744_c0_g1~~TRINITY_DN15744_c0_g1_i1.p1  ORF type:complete len:219 (+),score=23.34 TRINITY_DN15744_c0_g1_i1:28-684(+)